MLYWEAGCWLAEAEKHSCVLLRGSHYLWKGFPQGHNTEGMVQWEAQAVHQGGSRIWQIMFKSLPHDTGFEGMKGSCREAGWQDH